MRLDVSTGRLERVTAHELAADLAGSPRGLIVGGSPQTGVVSDGYGVVFTVRGARLIPMIEKLLPAGRPRSEQDPVSSPTKAFDTRTRKQVRFRVPDGYRGAEEFTAFEWLDDDRLALMNAANTWRQATGEILVCRISTGRCELAVGEKESGGDTPRIAPHLPFPANLRSVRTPLPRTAIDARP